MRKQTPSPVEQEGHCLKTDLSRFFEAERHYFGALTGQPARQKLVPEASGGEKSKAFRWLGSLLYACRLGQAERGFKIQCITCIPMYKPTTRSRLDAVANSKRRRLREQRMAESKMDKLPDKEFFEVTERKAFHRAVKIGEKESKKRRIEQVKRCQRIGNNLPNSS